MWFGRWREVYMGADMARLAQVREALGAADIEYRVKTVNRSFHSRGYMGTGGMSPSLLYTYYIYVRKEDYDKALAAASLYRP